MLMIFWFAVPSSRSSMLAAALLFTFLFGRPAIAATLPAEFKGVWITADKTQNECKKTDWGPGYNDRLINVDAKGWEMIEASCTIKSVKNVTLPGAPTSDVIVNLSCGGEGMMWDSREIWHVRNVSNRKIFAMATLHTSNYRAEGAKKAEEPPPPSVQIYLECK